MSFAVSQGASLERHCCASSGAPYVHAPLRPLCAPARRCAPTPQLLRLRIGLHKFAKEGLLCVLESCNKEEFDLVSGPTGPGGTASGCHVQAGR